MEITKSSVNGEITFTLVGRLDTATAPQLQANLIPIFDETSTVTLDFEKVAYVSSAGLRVLLLGEKTAKQKDGKMTLINVSQEIIEIFDMTGFSDVLKIV